MKSKQEQTFTIDRSKLKFKEGRVKLNFMIFSIVIIGLIGLLYYNLIGVDNFPIFILMSIVVCSLIIYSIYSGLRNARRMWETFNIKINEESIEFCFDKPIINEFEKTKWKRENQSIFWKNVRLKPGKKIVLIDKTKSSLNRIFMGKGGLVIPQEMENYDHLISEVKKKITLDKK